MKRIAVVVAAVLAGCSSSGPVEVSKDTYLITKQSAGGLFVQPSSIRVEIMREASAFCTHQGRVFQLNSFVDSPAVPGRSMPGSEVNFMCLDKDDPELARVKLAKEADRVIELRQR